MSISIVTGANRGIGLALCSALKARGATVVAACRKSSPALDALDVEVITGVDVSTDEGVERLRSAAGPRKVGLLINNAGILAWGDELDALKVEEIRRQFEINALAPLRVTAALKAQMDSNSKVAMVTSRMGSIEDNDSGGYYGYRMSKVALNMAAKSLAIDLKPSGICVAVLHPGMVKTDMVGEYGQVEPEHAAAGLLARIDELTLHSSGSFFHANGEPLPW